MPKTTKRNMPPQLASTQTTDAHQQLLSESHQRLTRSGQQLQQSAKNAGNTAISTNNISPQLMRTLNEKGNDPQLLADILKPTVEALSAAGLLTWGRTQSGKLFILLSDTFNDDLTLRK